MAIIRRSNTNEEETVNRNSTRNTTRNNDNQDDGNGEKEVITTPIFTTISAPKISKISQDYLLDWMARREQYEKTIKERCRNTGEDIKKILIGVKESFEPILLNSCLRYK